MSLILKVLTGLFTAIFAVGAVLCAALLIAVRIDQADRDWYCTEDTAGAERNSEGVWECTDAGAIACILFVPS